MPDIKPPTGAKAPPQTAPTKPQTPQPPAPKDKPDKAEVKKEEKKKRNLNLRGLVQKPLRLFYRFQIPIIILAIGVLLALTSLRMLGFSNPEADEDKITENLSKTKPVKIDPKSVERIKALSDSNVSTGTKVQQGRDNPFEE